MSTCIPADLSARLADSHTHPKFGYGSKACSRGWFIDDHTLSADRKWLCPGMEDTK